MASPKEVADDRLAKGEISQREHADIVRRLKSPTLLDPVPWRASGKTSGESIMQGDEIHPWFYASGSEKKGPYDREAMIALARSNIVGPETLVWTGGMQGWEPLGTLPFGAEISALLAPGVPPALPRPGARPDATAPPAIGQIEAWDDYTPASPVGFVEAIRLAFRKYFDFRTRIGRPEFWYFVLFSVLGSLLTTFIDITLFGSGFEDFSPLNSIFSLALIIPSLSAGARRLHDIDRSGWWQLIGLVPLIGVIVLIVFWCTEGTRGRNRFG